MQAVRSEEAAESRAVFVGYFGANRDSLIPSHGLPPVEIDGRPLRGLRRDPQLCGDEGAKRRGFLHPLTPRSPFDRLTALSNVEGLRSRRPSPRRGEGIRLHGADNTMASKPK
jgi:hypothetical protein